MGEVIRGPWRRPQGPDLTRVLSDEIARMTRALEDLRELPLGRRDGVLQCRPDATNQHGTAPLPRQ